MTIIPIEELEINVYQSKPGGFANVMANGVSVTHLPTGTVARYHAGRSQHINRAIALEMLEAALTHPRHRP